MDLKSLTKTLSHDEHMTKTVVACVKFVTNGNAPMIIGSEKRKKINLSRLNVESAMANILCTPLNELRNYTPENMRGLLKGYCKWRTEEFDDKSEHEACVETMMVMMHFHKAQQLKQQQKALEAANKEEVTDTGKY